MALGDTVSVQRDFVQIHYNINTNKGCSWTSEDSETEDVCRNNLSTLNRSRDQREARWQVTLADSGRWRDGYQHDLLAVTANCVSRVMASSQSCPPLWTFPEVTCRVYLKLVPSTSSRAPYITFSPRFWLTPPNSSVWLPVAVFVKPVSWRKQPCCESCLCLPLWTNRALIFLCFLPPTAAVRARELRGKPAIYESVSWFVFCLPAGWYRLILIETFDLLILFAGILLLRMLHNFLIIAHWKGPFVTVNTGEAQSESSSCSVQSKF